MKVIGVTSCACGIAHSYMAAEGIRKICKEKGYPCKVEIQGALGVENELTAQEIAQADHIVFANDVGITRAERFEGYQDKIKTVTPGEVIKNPSCIF